MRKRMALHHFARGINFEQLRRHREHRLPGPPLDLFPRAAAQPVELRLGAVAADVALGQVDALDGDVHPRFARVLEVEKIAFDFRDLQMLEPAILANPVVDMHHEVAGLELLQIEQDAPGRRARSATHARLAENVLLAVDIEPVALQHCAGEISPSRIAGR